MITSDFDDTTEIEQSLFHAQMAFNTLRKILCSQRLHVDRRRQLYQMCVLSVLLAGCETWAVRHSHLQALASFHNRCTRTICGINLRHCQMHKISPKRILEWLDIPPIERSFTHDSCASSDVLHPWTRLVSCSKHSHPKRRDYLEWKLQMDGRPTHCWPGYTPSNKLGSTREGPVEKWRKRYQNIRSSICATLAEETLELPFLALCVVTTARRHNCLQQNVMK